jgi:hypothetical protein
MPREMPSGPETAFLSRIRQDKKYALRPFFFCKERKIGAMKQGKIFSKSKKYRIVVRAAWKRYSTDLPCRHTGAAKSELTASTAMRPTGIDEIFGLSSSK